MALHDSSDDAISKIASLIQEHYVSRKVYDKLKQDFDLLQQEHLRSKQIFQAKLTEWETIKQSLVSRSPSNRIKADDKLKLEKENPLHMPKAPRLGNKASKRIILGGDTPPGFWSTRFTPET